MKRMRYFLLALSLFFIISVSTQAEPLAMFKLQSTSFSDRKDIPVLYTCDGRDVSPQLSWNGAPMKTQSYVLICADPDAPAGTWYHWVIYNIPVSVLNVAEGSISVGVLGKNSWGRAQYNGPCPPASSTHHYHFMLYALDSQLSLPSGADANAVIKAMQGHILEQAMIMGIFGH